MSKTSALDGARYIGAAIPRAATRRLVAGRGQYTDDISLKGELHAAFLRSPRPHATFAIVDTGEARSADGVVAVLVADDIDKMCKTWQCVLTNAPNLFSPPQRPLARERVVFQGEPIAMVVAATRAQAEDALERIEVQYEDLPAVTSLEHAMSGNSLTHAGAASNRGLRIPTIDARIRTRFRAGSPTSCING